MNQRDEAAWVGRITDAVMRSAQPTAGIAQPAHRWIVAYSGGVDSTALLHVLRQAHAADAGTNEHGSVIAVHVHHGLHPGADAWAAHCRRTCDALGIPLTVLHVAVARNSGEGLEAAARRARYAAFESVIDGPGDVLITAHHRDDQAETFLLRALRASGTDGLGAMRDWRKFGAGRLWRPLLDVTRAELVAYAERSGLAWIDDPSNFDTAPDRNFLRQTVLPLLSERWPHAGAAFARTAALLAESADLLDAEDARCLATAGTIDDRVLALEPLLAMPPARRARVLRRWVAGLGLPPLPAAGIARIESDLLHADADAAASFAWSDAIIERWNDLLHADRQRPTLADGYRVEWDGSGCLQLPTGDQLSLSAGAAFDGPLLVHGRHGGERIALPGRQHTHALKHVLQDLGVPRWERERVPLLSSADGDLLAAGDLACSAGFDAWLRARGCRLHWTRDPGNAMS